MAKLSQEKVEELMKIVQQQVVLSINEGNSPFAAVLVDEKGKIIAEGRNRQNTLNDPTAHGEILLLREAGRILKTRKLHGYKVIVNAEPCSMCMSAIVKAYIQEIYYGAPQEECTDPNIRAVDVKEKTNAPLLIFGGYLEESCKEQIQRGRDRISEEKREFKN